MRKLQRSHILLFHLLNQHFLLLTRRQIERVLTLPTNSSNKVLGWMVSDRYLERRYRADTFKHFQTPMYYLGPLGWRVVGNAGHDYKGYQNRVEDRATRQMDHLLSVYDVLLKFILEAEIKKVIDGESRFWQESLGFGNVPDSWVQFEGGEAFIEVDQETETVETVSKKIANYVRFNQSGTYDILFPKCAFRVLFITTTEARIESLQQVTTSDDIWFATKEEFLREKLDHPHWFALRGFYALPAATKKEMQKLP